MPCKLVFALFIAMVLNMKIRGIRFFQTLYYIPSILGGSVAVSVIWRFMFSHDGLVNTLTSYLGLPALDWLGSKALALPTVSLLAVWQFGSSMVLFLVGLKQIPVSLYEAASIDGASKVHQFFKITLPMLTPTVLFNVIMQTIGAFQEFTGAFIITGGGPYELYIHVRRHALQQLLQILQDGVRQRPVLDPVHHHHGGNGPAVPFFQKVGLL